jgi:hypothetical protein
MPFEAVAYYQEETRPEWDIYCIGTTTSKQVAHYFGEENVSLEWQMTLASLAET